MRRKGNTNQPFSTAECVGWESKVKRKMWKGNKIGKIRKVKGRKWNVKYLPFLRRWRRSKGREAEERWRKKHSRRREEEENKKGKERNKDVKRIESLCRRVRVRAPVFCCRPHTHCEVNAFPRNAFLGINRDLQATTSIPSALTFLFTFLNFTFFSAIPLILFLVFAFSLYTPFWYLFFLLFSNVFTPWFFKFSFSPYSSTAFFFSIFSYLHFLFYA